MKISIVTVVYNNRDFISNCISSVLGQSYKDIEYIIVDGASTDGTLEIIRSAVDSSVQVISEPDNGIYDAMNKGILASSGEVVGILNADDFYVHEDVVSRVGEVFEDRRIEACYADVEYVQRDRTDKVVRTWRSGPFRKKSFYFGWHPPHPTFFVRREVFLKNGLYNTDLKISADYEMMLRLLFVERINCAYLPEVIIRMRDGGISNRSLKNRMQANREDRRAWQLNSIRPKPYTLALKPIRKLGQFI